MGIIISVICFSLSTSGQGNLDNELEARNQGMIFPNECKVLE
ncbi:MAG: hypothetical protein ACRCST_04135 [Turicibacter sp.]